MKLSSSSLVTQVIDPPLNSLTLQATWLLLLAGGNLQLDIRDEELALSTLVQDGDLPLLDDGSDRGWERAGHREDRRGRVK